MKTKTTTAKRYDGFSDDERSAMKERVKEMKTSGRRGRGAKAEVDGEAELLAKIAEMQPSDRAMAERVHAIVKATAPELTPQTWYGMPAYYRDGKNVCFFKPAQKFKARYATLGFSDSAHLDDGNVWPTEYALTKLTTADEKKIAALVKQAVS